MKPESTVMYVLRLALTLLAITAVVAAALAGVNSITAPAIAELNARKTQDAIQLVLPGGGEAMADFPAVDLVSKVYEGENGYAVEVTPGGFDNTITMMVGVDTQGKVLGISIIKHTETAGLGAVAAAGTPAGENFRNEFVGASLCLRHQGRRHHGCHHRRYHHFPCGLRRRQCCPGLCCQYGLIGGTSHGFQKAN